MVASVSLVDLSLIRQLDRQTRRDHERPFCFMKKAKRTFKQNRIFTQNNPLSPRICPELAAEIGLHRSIMLLQFEFWIATEGEWREEDGNLWIRKTIREIKSVFSFWGTSTINRLINELVDAGYLEQNEFEEEPGSKNGRFLSFGFAKLTQLQSIKIICAETGQIVCAETEAISPEVAQTVIQTGPNNRSSPYIGNKSIKEIKTNTQRGTRLPVDFSITRDMREWGTRETPHLDLDRVLPEFVDYWVGVPGQRGTKLDWEATWRNRMRDLEGRAAKNGNGNGYQPSSKASRNRDAVKQVLAEARRTH